MSRFLFVVPPLTGHINPTVAVGQELMTRGHDVAWVGHAGKVQPLLFEGAHLIRLEEALTEERLQELQEKSNRVRGLEGMKFLWEEVLVPLARAMRPGVDTAVTDYRPDVMIVDQQAIGGAVVARLRDLPWATFTTSSAGVVETPLPKVWNWVLAQLATLQEESGLPVVERPDISPHLMVVFTTTALVGSRDFPDHYHFVGPALTRSRRQVDFPWDRLRKGRRLLVSLGTVNRERGGRFYRALVDVLEGRPEQVILAGRPDMLPRVPENFIVQDYLPQVDLLPHVDAVVCHAGQNTVSEALAQGLPLVVTPIKDDQGLVATQVVASGAGVRVRFGRLQARELGEAIDRVLSEPSYREAARRIQASFEVAGGACRAADLVEGLAP